MSGYREVKQGEQVQGIGERISYHVDVSPWGVGVITSPVCIVYDTLDNSDVTSTVMPSGAAAVSGSVIDTPLLRALTVGKRYRVVVGFTLGGNYYEAYFFVLAEL